MCRCLILMSTYNGEKYLREQLNSILRQDLKEWKLIIRDDGSTDNTICIIEEYIKLDTRISYYIGNNVGPANSFLELMKRAPSADYYAFSDQDDIWYDNKIQTAITQLDGCINEKGIPLLYVANQNILTSELEPLENRYGNYKEEDLNSLMQNIFLGIFSGCTMVFNSTLRRQFINNPQMLELANLRMHDIAVYLFAKVSGLVIYDSNPVMSYRRHGNNVTNEDRIVLMRLLPKYSLMIKHLVNNRKNVNPISRTASILLSSFDGYMDKKTKMDLKIVGSYRNSYLDKLILLARYDILQYATRDRFSSYAKVILNRI